MRLFGKDVAADNHWPRTYPSRFPQSNEHIVVQTTGRLTRVPVCIRTSATLLAIFKCTTSASRAEDIRNEVFSDQHLLLFAHLTKHRHNNK